jgi:hypothetical protein
VDDGIEGTKRIDLFGRGGFEQYSRDRQ